MDWLMGFGGGLMIGLAAAGYLLFNGRISGISGIFGGLVDGTEWRDWAERLAFVAGLVIVPSLLTGVLHAQTHITGNWPVLVAGGLLVGFGTRLGNGCTSGHGVCGMARLSRRSLFATVCYVGAGMVSMALLRHIWQMV